jgi:hypothetical protein
MNARIYYNIKTRLKFFILINEIEKQADLSFALISRPFNCCFYFKMVHFHLRAPSYIRTWRKMRLSAAARLNVINAQPDQLLPQASLCGRPLMRYKSGLATEDTVAAAQLTLLLYCTAAGQTIDQGTGPRCAEITCYRRPRTCE